MMRPTTTGAMVAALKAAEQDHEWYPTTTAMLAAIKREMPTERYSRGITSILDVGAGDGRALVDLCGDSGAALYAIEKSPILMQAQPESVTPVGTDFHQQNLMALPADLVFSNPPYSEFEEWAARIIETAHASYIALVLPQRWTESEAIAAALALRDVKPRVIYTGDFYDAPRQARAKVDILWIAIKEEGYYSKAQDPFDIWFDQNISTFDQEQERSTRDEHDARLARLHRLDSIPSLVAAYDEDYARLEANYRAIFTLDYAILKELGVDKDGVRKGLKERMRGLKNVYWEALFTHLDVITSRLSTKTKARFRERIAAQTSVAFTESNAYAIALWVIKFANAYFDQQLVELFRELATHDGVQNYKSNTRTWEKDGWRYDSAKFDHFALDYRIVKHHYEAIPKPDSFRSWDAPGGLAKSCHELIDDMIAVFGNLGFRVVGATSRTRKWRANEWQDFRDRDGEIVFQVKGFLNGNLHLRMRPAVIRTLNIDAARLLGWVRDQKEAAEEMGYSADEVATAYGSNQRVTLASIPLLPQHEPDEPVAEQVAYRQGALEMEAL